ncbi:MAG: DUF2946 family protein [Micavibrio sp.]
MYRTAPMHHWFLTLAAALFLAVGPALAPVLSASPKAQYIEICTSFGLIKKAIEGGPDQHHADQSSHCLFCNLREIALLPPSVILPLPVGFVLANTIPVAIVLAGTAPSHSYNPRAPPVLLI